jgi:hypothetical protein
MPQVVDWKDGRALVKHGLAAGREIGDIAAKHQRSTPAGLSDREPGLRGSGGAQHNEEPPRSGARTSRRRFAARDGQSFAQAHLKSEAVLLKRSGRFGDRDDDGREYTEE